MGVSRTHTTGRTGERALPAMTPPGSGTPDDRRSPPGDAATDPWHRWAELDPLFDAALNRPPEQRDAFLEQACGKDAELLRTLHRLLDVADTSDGRLAQPGPSLLQAALADGDH